MLVETVAELRCCSFYEAHGGVVVHRAPGTLAGGSVTDVVYRWREGVSHGRRRYRLRPATIEDVGLVFALKRSGYREHVEAIWGEWNDDWQRERFMSGFDPDATKIVVVDGHDVGVLTMDWQAEPVFLASIELHPAHRGRGLGREVIADVIERAEALDRGIGLQVLQTNHRAVQLYERLGFGVVDRSDTHIRMRRSRGPAVSPRRQSAP